MSRRAASEGQRDALVLVAITVGGLVLRSASVGLQSLWDDELFTAWIVRGGFVQMLHRIANVEATPPLYYLAIWPWARLFGDGEIGLRSLSVLFGTAAIPITYLAARERWNPRVARWTALLVATNPFLVWYGQEARSYALLVPMGALVLLFFLRASHRADPVALACWAAASSACVLAHYFGAFLVGPTAVWLAIEHRDRLRAVALAASVPLATGLALLPLAIHQQHAVADPGATGTSSFATRVAALPKNMLVGYTLPAELLITMAVALLATIAVVLAIRGGVRAWIAPATIGAAAIVVPVALGVLGADYVTSRNLIAALLPILLILAVGIATSRLGAVIGVGVCALSLVVVGAVVVDPSYRRRDWRGAAEAAGATTTARAVVFAPGFVNPGPFETYFDAGRVVRDGSIVVGEIDVIALALVGQYGTGVPRPPREAAHAAPDGFRLVERQQAATYTLLRYRSAVPRRADVEELRSLMLADLGAAVVLQEP